MPTITEIAPDVYRICVLYPEINLQFNHFVVRDDEPLLFHAGLRRMFPEVREAVATLLDLAEAALDQLESLRKRQMRRAE